MELLLNGDLVTLIDDEDAERVAAYSWKAYWTKRGKRYYVTSSGTGGKTIYLHRFIMDASKGNVVDHKNGDSLNNQKHNLRQTTQQNNCFNSKGKGSNTGFKGVSFSKERRKYFASIMHNRRTIPLGRYATPEEAAKAYNEAARRLFGEFALLNPVS